MEIFEAAGTPISMSTLGRLSEPEAFANLMRRRPVATNDWLMVYAQPFACDARSSLGFVIPKKVLRKAVQRNKVRRWCRAYWQSHPLTVPHHLLVRCRGKPRWTTPAERKTRYGALMLLCDQAFQALECVSQ